jgi:hypothetical protein
MSWLYSFFGSHKDTVTKEDGDIIDAITYVASLVSKPSEIDPTLDTVREITSKLTPGEPLSPTDKTALGRVYEDIEYYLTTKDPIRKFTPEEVRRRVHDRFPNFKFEPPKV